MGAPPAKTSSYSNHAPTGFLSVDGQTGSYARIPNYAGEKSSSRNFVVAQHSLGLVASNGVALTRPINGPTLEAIKPRYYVAVANPKPSVTDPPHTAFPCFTKTGGQVSQ